MRSELTAPRVSLTRSEPRRGREIVSNLPGKCCEVWEDYNGTRWEIGPNVLELN